MFIVSGWLDGWNMLSISMHGQVYVSSFYMLQYIMSSICLNRMLTISYYKTS